MAVKRNAMYRIRSRTRKQESARIAATDAAKHFGRLVSRVREERASYVIERAGRAVARIEPVGTSGSTMSALKALIAARPQVDGTYLRAVERAARRHNA